MPKQKAKQIIDKQLPQDVVAFQPTPTMRVWLDTAIEIVSDSPTEIANASKIARQTWYDWMDLSGFENWFYEEYKRKRIRWLPKLDKIGMEYAMSGKYDFWKDMNKKTGELLDDKEPNVQVNVMNQIKSDKDKYGI